LTAVVALVPEFPQSFRPHARALFFSTDLDATEGWKLWAERPFDVDDTVPHLVHAFDVADHKHRRDGIPGALHRASEQRAAVRTKLVPTALDAWLGRESAPDPDQGDSDPLRTLLYGLAVKERPTRGALVAELLVRLGDGRDAKGLVRCKELVAFL